MRKLFLMVALLLAFTAVANAQTPQGDFEGYVGVQYDRANFDVRNVNTQSFTFNRSTDGIGGNLAITGFVSDHVGITGDFSATFSGGRDDNSLITALGGITVKARNNARFQPFVRVLAGVARQRVASAQLVNNYDLSDANFAGLVGAGLDINLKENSRYKWRLIQVDYMRTSSFDSGVNGFVRGGQDHLRLGTGFVF